MRTYYEHKTLIKSAVRTQFKKARVSFLLLHNHNAVAIVI